MAEAKLHQEPSLASKSLENATAIISKAKASCLLEHSFGVDGLIPQELEEKYQITTKIGDSALLKVGRRC